MQQTKLKVTLPENTSNLSQDEEYCIVQQNGKKERIRFHNYHDVYNVPGLYEHLFYNLLKCRSHEVISSMLSEELEHAEMSTDDLVVLELGAGNGVVAETLADQGVDTIVGVDIIPEAKEAAERDRPELYDEYYVEDFCDISDDTRSQLEQTDFNCLVCVAALGFGDIPPKAFAEAYNLLEEDSWVAFNIKDDFVNPKNDSTGFSRLIAAAIDEDRLQVCNRRTYCHRLSIQGKPLEYVAMIGRKHGPIDVSMSK